MFLSRMIVFRLPLVGGLAAAAAALLLAAGPAAAQPTGASKLWPWNVQGSPAVSARPAAATPATTPHRATVLTSVDVTVTEAATAKPFYVTIRGPGNETRAFELLGGREAIRTREVIVHPGQQLTIPVSPSAKVEAPPTR